MRFFGSWGTAVERAGFNYGNEKQAALSANDVLNWIRKLAVTEGTPPRAGDHPIVARARKNGRSKSPLVSRDGLLLDENTTLSMLTALPEGQRCSRHPAAGPVDKMKEYGLGPKR